jgi:hypothetical protein
LLCNLLERCPPLTLHLLARAHLGGAGEPFLIVTGLAGFLGLLPQGENVGVETLKRRLSEILPSGFLPILRVSVKEFFDGLMSGGAVVKRILLFLRFG